MVSFHHSESESEKFKSRNGTGFKVRKKKKEVIRMFVSELEFLLESVWKYFTDFLNTLSLIHNVDF